MDKIGFSRQTCFFEKTDNLRENGLRGTEKSVNKSPKRKKQSSVLNTIGISVRNRTKIIILHNCNMFSGLNFVYYFPQNEPFNSP